MEGTQVRDRFIRWMDEARELFALLPEVLNHDQRTDQAEKETERLRRELNELRKELGDAKIHMDELRKGHADALRELEEVLRQNETLRAEKEEAGQALAKVLETVQATNQIAQKLGVTKSPFARRDGPAGAPQPAPHD
jgi:chromosome segregation ATPase